MISNLLIISIAFILIIGVILYFYIQLSQGNKEFEKEHGKPAPKFSQFPLIFQILFLAVPVSIIGFIIFITIIILIFNNAILKSNKNSIRNRNIYN